MGWWWLFVHVCLGFDIAQYGNILMTWSVPSLMPSNLWRFLCSPTAHVLALPFSVSSWFNLLNRHTMQILVSLCPGKPANFSWDFLAGCLLYAFQFNGMSVCMPFSFILWLIWNFSYFIPSGRCSLTLNLHFSCVSHPDWICCRGVYIEANWLYRCILWSLVVVLSLVQCINTRSAQVPSWLIPMRIGLIHFAPTHIASYIHEDYSPHVSSTCV